MLKTLLMSSALDVKHRVDGQTNSVVRRVPRGPDGRRVDDKGNLQPLFLDLINVLFRPTERSIEQGIAFLQ